MLKIKALISIYNSLFLNQTPGTIFYSKLTYLLAGLLRSTCIILMLVYSSCSQAQTPKPEFGIHSHITKKKSFDLESEFAAQNTLLEIARDKESRLIRTGFLWRDVEQKPGEWDWSAIDEVVENAEKHDLQLIAVLHESPAWAKKPLEKNLEGWKEFVSRVTERYKGRITRWEVWNEPNLSHRFKSAQSKQFFSELLKESYKIIKSTDADNRVVLGGMASQESAFPFWKTIFTHGALQYCDAVAIHPYQFPAESLVDYLDRLRKLMGEYGEVKPVWITEYGNSSRRNPIHPAESTIFVELIEKASAETFPNQENLQIGFVEGKLKNTFFEPLADQLQENGWKTESININTNEGQEKLRSQESRILIVPADSQFSRAQLQDIYDSVKDGGLMVSMDGIPLVAYATEEGDEKPVRYTNDYRQKFKIRMRRIRHRNVAKKREVKIADGVELSSNPQSNIFINRILRNPRDENISYTPLLSVYDGGREMGEIASLFKYSTSEFNGSVLMIPVPMINGDSFEVQSVQLSKTVLSAWATGVETFIAFELRDNKYNVREKYYGLLDENMNPKPAFDSYSNLIELVSSHTVLDYEKKGNGMSIQLEDDKNGEIVYIGWGDHFRKKMDSENRVFKPLDIITNATDESSIYIARNSTNGI